MENFALPLVSYANDKGDGVESLRTFCCGQGRGVKFSRFCANFLYRWLLGKFIWLGSNTNLLPVVQEFIVLKHKLINPFDVCSHDSCQPLLFSYCRL